MPGVMSVVATFVVLGVLLAAGRVMAARRLVDERAPDALNSIAIALFFPASILLHAGGLRLEPALAALVIIAWLNVAAGLGVGALVRRLLGLDVDAAAVVGLSVAFGNTAFMGYAVVPSLVASPAEGPTSLAYAVVYDQLGSFVALSTVGLALIARRGSLNASNTANTANGHGLADGARRVLTFPPFIALVVGVCLPDPLPTVAQEVLSALAAPLMPVMALAVGMRLRLQMPRSWAMAVVVVCVAKLVVLPLGAWGLARVLGVSPTITAVAVLQTGMPVMITVGALLQAARIAPDLAAAVVGASTVVSLVTLPLWGSLLG